MELALYCPVYGFYEAEKDRIGRHADYYTSVSVGSLFGRLLAFQFTRWLSAPERPAPMLIEAGADDGRLAADILGWLQKQRPQLFDRLQYWIIEPSPRRQERQCRTLEAFGTTIRWATSLDKLSGTDDTSDQNRVRAIIFANELLDAMPVHRVGWDASHQRWFEYGVTLSQGKFEWQRMEPEPTVLERVPQLPEPLLQALPDGFSLEINRAAQAWWRRAAKMLDAGRLVTMDYGGTQDELLAPERIHGTLRSYFRHAVSGDVLANPGERDITASVNFSAISEAGEAEGLKTEAWINQETFLTRIAAEAWKPENNFGEWTTADTRQFQTLTRPEHLGRPFRVLVQRSENAM